MSVQIHRIPRPTSPDAPPHPLLVGLCDVDRGLAVECYGHDDYWEPAEAVTRQFADTAYGTTDAWVALAVGADPQRCAQTDVLGFVQVELSTAEDLDNALVWVGVRPEQRGRGLGSALYAAAGEFIAETGRSVQISWQATRAMDAAAPDALVAASGSGAVDALVPATRWLLANGFVLEQAERMSMLDLPTDRSAFVRQLVGLRDQACAVAGAEYRLIGWQGATPEAWLDAVAALRRRMSVDVPTAGLEFGEAAWDADRVRDADIKSAAKGRTRVGSFVQHVPSGRLVAYTYLIWSTQRPAAIWQGDTLVHGEHRGRRLGLAIKAANLLRLLDANPDARRVHTANASENGHMLAINDALGFAVSGVEGVWQKRTAVLGQP